MLIFDIGAKIYANFQFLFRMKAVFGHFSADNFKILLKKDLDALNDFLGSKDYFGGDRMNLVSFKFLRRISIILAPYAPS